MHAWEEIRPGFGIVTSKFGGLTRGKLMRFDCS